MSWWNTSSISSFASQALKNAQKKIDKVLDIEDEENNGQTTGDSKLLKEGESTSVEASDDTKTTTKEENSWNSWMSLDTDKSKTSESAARSSWSLPSWGISTEEKSSTNKKSLSLASSTQTVKSTTAKGKDILKVNKPREKGKSTSVSKDETKEIKDKIETSPKTDVEGKTAKSKTASVRETENENKQGLKLLSSDIKEVKLHSEKVSEELTETHSKNVSDTRKLTQVQDSQDSCESIIDENKLLESTNVVEEKLADLNDTYVSEKITENINVELVDRKQNLDVCDDTEQDETVKTIGSVIIEQKDDIVKHKHEVIDQLSLDHSNKNDTCIKGSSESVIISSSASDHRDSITNVSSSSNEQMDDQNTTGQVYSKESFISDLGQSDWASDVSWNTLENTQQFTSDSLENIGSAKKRNISGELQQETQSITTQNETKTTEKLHTENLNQSVPLKTCDTVPDRTESSQDSESKTDTNSDASSTSKIPASESSASLEIIESSEVIPDTGNSYTEILNSSVSYESTQENNSEPQPVIESISKSGFMSENTTEQKTLEENTSDTKVDETCMDDTQSDPDMCRSLTQEKEVVTDDTQCDPAEAYIKEVITHDLPLSPSAASSLGGTDSDNSKLDSSMDTYTSEDTVIDRDKTEIDSQEAVGDEEEGDVEEGNDHSASSGSPSSSFVKCMLEDAMEDGCKMEDNGSDSYSTGGEKSECSRSTGGQESGDEIDTTTSSDIEIISTPTPNGNDKLIDLSPLKIALQKTAKKGSQTHRRSDSQSSSSTQSREGHGEQLSPGRDHGLDRHEIDHHGYSEDLPPLSEETSNDPYHPQKLLKLQTVPEHAAFVTQSENTDLTTTATMDNSDVDDSMIQKLAEMSEILQARENKLVQLSHENNDLLEANSILRNQLQQSEEARESEMEDLNNLTSEFTERMAESEKKLQTVIREKEMMKKQLQQIQEEFGKKDSSVTKVLQEKDQQISELLQEGEKLSKQQLQSNNIIKKLRVKEKESDSLIASQKKKLEEQKTELEHLRKVLDSKEEMEKKQTDAINQLNAAVQKQERDMAKYKNEYEDNQERIRGLQSALDSSYKEIAELNKFNAAQDSKAQEAALSVEMQVREELKLMLEREQLKHKHEKEALIMQMEDLRLTMSRMEKDHSRREDLLRQEISDLQVGKFVKTGDIRSTSATRPLLRQIENLQSTYTAQSTSWEKIEKNLSDRLVETQSQLANATEKERCASEKLMELTTKLTSLETQNAHLKQDKSQLTAELEIIKTKLEVLEDSKTNEMAQIEAVKHQMNQEMAQLKKEKMFIETQLDMEKTKTDQEKKKLAIAQEQISQLERESQRAVSRGTPSPISVSRAESISSEPPIFSSLTQNDIQQLERTRESMARELVNLSNQNEELQEKVKELPEMIEKYRELDQKNNALLLMYGEKVEEANELRMDLEDVKDMYKTQVCHLSTVT
ncbi:hypothetical protein KUTeg_003942 [Tegillarca granosa]|uniref:TATA element modulatory factor 1 TATA binding domain-containing protein n=1 Tax=Tegillarca granosa TaxID=220873 RepID=A0ABQ9FRR6_TEGGR|nr:hypothetical protein KUTeg_003942 [Tegillarca granosa]